MTEYGYAYAMWLNTPEIRADVDRIFDREGPSDLIEERAKAHVIALTGGDV